jgi:adenosylcobinamide kinase/adenosylcobinamide-phosphate guanylyltransferase
VNWKFWNGRFNGSEMSFCLVLGGARSGKSAYAQSLAEASGQPVTMIATAQAGDSEMAERIALHRQERPSGWITVEEPVALGEALQRAAHPGQVVLVDCITLWLSNLMFSGAQPFPDVGPVTLPPLFHAQRDALLQALADCPGEVVVVSNELGLGIVPYGAVSRVFADEAGRMNQALARQADKVVMMIAGLPLVLKGG